VAIHSCLREPFYGLKAFQIVTSKDAVTQPRNSAPFQPWQHRPLLNPPFSPPNDDVKEDKTRV
jgi:hypothetical protein